MEYVVLFMYFSVHNGMDRIKFHCIIMSGMISFKALPQWYAEEKSACHKVQAEWWCVSYIQQFAGYDVLMPCTENFLLQFLDDTTTAKENTYAVMKR